MAAQQRGVVVTGSAKGIGRACVLRLARAGFRVYAGVRNEADGESLRAEAGANAIPVHIDVTQADTIAAATSLIRSDLADAPLVGLVNNAGIAIAGPLEFLPLDELRRQFEVNVIGQLAMAQALLPLLRASRGRIVNMGSISGKSALPLVGPYAASKHALEAITDSLRVELHSAGVDVVIIEPGVIATPIWQTSTAAAEKMLAHAPQAVQHYGRLLERVADRAKRGASRGLPADVVARVVEAALTARRPKTRYLVGRDARLRALFQHLPDRWRDGIIAWQLSRI
jgi:NAD(P)-dependent dehydrogenase (short-subunit alcohol dehydrogenase family)